MAKVSGIAIRPVLSRNKRKYSREALASAAKRMQARIADPNASPITMRSHHGAGDDSLRVAGRVTAVKLTDEGAIAYEGVTADTEAGRAIATLAKPGADGGQFIKHVSIRGYWMGETHEDPDGNEWGDDLEIDGLDFTASPGVPGASVTAESAPGHTETVERKPIT